MALNLSLGLEKWLPFQTYNDAEKMAEAALKAKTQAAETRVKEANEATRIAAEVLRASREEVRSIKAVVQSLKKAAGASPSEEAARMLEEERAKVREAQMHVAGLTKSFETVLTEMEKIRDEDPLLKELDDKAAAQAHIDAMRPAEDRGDGSRAVAIARVVLLGYSLSQAETALDAAGKSDSKAAVAYLKNLGAVPEADAAAPPVTKARLGHASRPQSPPPEIPVFYPKGRPPAAAGAAVWPSMARARKGKGDIFVARKRAVEVLVALTSRQFSAARPEVARDYTLTSLTAQKVLAHNRVARRLMLLAGSLEACSGALAAFRRDPPVVCAACSVLRELTAFADSMDAVRRNPKVSAAALAAIAAMKSSPANAGVQTQTAGLLWGLCGLLGAPVQSILLNADASAFLLNALSAFPKNRELVWRVCGCLLAMAKGNPETQKYLAETGARDAVRKALLADPGMQYGGEFSTLRPWMRAGAPPTPAASAAGRDEDGPESKAVRAPPTARGGRALPPDLQQKGSGGSAGARAGDAAASQRSRHLHPQAEPRDPPPGPVPVHHPSLLSAAEREEKERLRRAEADARAAELNAAQEARERAAKERDALLAAQREFEAEAEREAARLRSAGAGPRPEQQQQQAPPSSQQQQQQSRGAGLSHIEQAVFTLLDETAGAEALSAAFRVLTKECGLGNARAVCEAGGVAAASTALGNRLESLACAADACLLLGMITQESDAAELALRSPAVQDGTTVTAVITALQAHPDVIALQATGAWALWGLVRGSKENAMRATSLGAPELLVATMHRFTGSPEVAQSAAGALLAIAMAGKWAQEAVARVGGPATVKEMMRAHPSITFRGEFDSLREWLRASTANK